LKFLLARDSLISNFIFTKLQLPSQHPLNQTIPCYEHG